MTDTTNSCAAIGHALESGRVAAPQGGIMGVYSTSEKTPVKARGFGIADAGTVNS